MVCGKCNHLKLKGYPFIEHTRFEYQCKQKVFKLFNIEISRCVLCKTYVYYIYEVSNSFCHFFKSSITYKVKYFSCGILPVA